MAAHQRPLPLRRFPVEETVDWKTRMPAGYVFLQKGNKYLTAKCRKLTHIDKENLLYVEKRDGRTTGLRVPHYIFEEASRLERETRDKRREAVEKRELKLRNEFIQTIYEDFPGAPTDEVPMIIDRTLEKGCGRVGRRWKLRLRERVRLAVNAHIRHNHTEYELMMDTNQMRSRFAVHAQFLDTLRQWSWVARPNGQPRDAVPTLLGTTSQRAKGSIEGGGVLTRFDD